MLLTEADPSDVHKDTTGVFFRKLKGRFELDTSLVFYFVLTFAVNGLLLWESGNPIDSWRSCYDIGDRACYIILWIIFILGIYTIIHQVTGQGIVISWK